MKSRIFLMLIITIQLMLIPIIGKTQGDLCNLVGFSTPVFLQNQQALLDVSGISVSVGAQPHQLSALPGSNVTQLSTNNIIVPTNTSAYDPESGNLVCFIANEEKMLLYEENSETAQTVNLPHKLTAPVFINGKLYAILIKQNTIGMPIKFDLYTVSLTGSISFISEFTSPYNLQGTFSPNLISSATNGSKEIYLVSGIHFVLIKLGITPLAFFNMLTTSTQSNFLGLEYVGTNSLIAIESSLSSLDIVLIDLDLQGNALNTILSSAYPLSTVLPTPPGWIINQNLYSTALDVCNGLYYICTYNDPMFSSSRLLTYDINNTTIQEEYLNNYIFGIEVQSNKCCQSYPCEAKVDHISGKDSEFGTSIALDQDGFIYTTGGFTNEADFICGGSPLNLIVAGTQDMYISKHDENTDCVHALKLGVTGINEGRGIAVAPSGNVYVTGFYSHPSNQNIGAIVVKLDNNLNITWQKVFYSVNGMVVGNAIALDENENIYFTGYFTGRAQFDNFVFSSVGGSADVFIVCLNSQNGNAIWARDLGGDGFDEGKGIAVDQQGNVSVVGDFEYSIQVPHANFSLASYGGRDVFLIRHNQTGVYDWINILGGSGDEAGNAIAVDPDGDIYITGDFTYSPLMNGFSFINLAQGGLKDTYVSKHKQDGNSPAIWSAQLRGSDSAKAGRGWSIALNKSGNRVYTSGIFDSVTDFDPGNGNYFLNPQNSELFVSRLDASNGAYINALRLGPYGVNSGGFPDRRVNAIAIDKNDCVHTTGTFFGNVDFNPGPGSIPIVNLQAVEFFDAFVHKLCCCCDDQDQFDQLLNQGWKVDIDETDCSVTVTLDQFGSCHYLSQASPDWGDGTPTFPTMVPANNSWTHTYNASGTYNICAWVNEIQNGTECWWAQMCVQIEIECCPGPSSVFIPDVSACTTDPSFTIPINCPGTCTVGTVEWFIKDINATAFPTTPYQSTPGPMCTGLQISPGQFGNHIQVYAVIYFDPPCCGNIQQYTTNVATVTLCIPNACSITNPNMAGFCGSGIPMPLQLNIFGTGCGNSSIEWFYNGNLVSNSSHQYQPPPLSFDGDTLVDCYTEHKFTVKLSGVCPDRTCHTSIFVYNPNSPLGFLEMNPVEVQPFCYGEDATLKYDHACAGIPSELWIPKWKWHSTTTDPPAIANYQLIPGAGTSNPVYNTNQLFETTWFMVEKQNGVCPKQNIEYKIEVLEPLVINDFQAVTNPCAEDWVNFSLDFTPSNIAQPQTAEVLWFVNGFHVGTSVVNSSPATYTFQHQGNIAGVYYAELVDLYCNTTVTSLPVTIDPSCIPVISGPCYRCFADTNPIELTGDMVIPPGLPCPDISNCIFQWYEVDISGNMILIPNATGLTHISAHAGTFILFSECNGCQKWSLPHKVIQCDQTFTSTDEPKGFLSVKIYPNPAMNEVNIKLSPPPNKNMNIVLTDINGQNITSSILQAHTDLILMQLNGIRPGFYLLYFYEDNRLIWVEKIIINN